MPHTIGNGKTTMQNLVLEGQSIIEALKREFTGMTQAVDAIEEADLSNDPDLSAALTSLKTARDLENPTQKDCELNTAQTYLETAIQKDFGDLTIAQMKAQLLPFQQKIEALATQLNHLQGELSKAGKQRAA